jgi:hypothetical protein
MFCPVEVVDVVFLTLDLNGFGNVLYFNPFLESFIEIFIF